MEYLKDVFGQEALTFGQFLERLEGQEDVKLANLAGGGYVGAEKHRALALQLEQLRGQVGEEEARHKAELEELRFSQFVESAIAAEGGRSAKAVRALLDLEGLKAQEEQELAVREAVQAVKRSEGYLFCDEVPAPFAAGTGTAPARPDAYRQALGIE